MSVNNSCYGSDLVVDFWVSVVWSVFGLWVEWELIGFTQIIYCNCMSFGGEFQGVICMLLFLVSCFREDGLIVDLISLVLVLFWSIFLRELNHVSEEC